ncbi:ABC-type glycerol-3-phosphate transport system substrate-binding protein [Actinoplanes lutulentus]|uniref:Uncharacterized protein n=1 Tax=Actinoplanes lutulentus TaxID=1287878 RepID=A0A327YZB6_9ACTN|nr:hypothetical protein [Actinoplanes lutulentus]MBB2946530.1 ABC-type glycerol-3-phosphate transport system substrate-binding protein [Actinoplanes lutulentus]RAK26448.1 hypothetical protein B0I29_12738 [Actinoplanes lutulentus]
MRTAAAALVLALTLAGCSIYRTSADLVGFRPGPGANEITVIYAQRPADAAGELEILSQDAEQVRVKVLYRAAGGAQDDVAVEREAVGELDAPLGMRTVVDDDGEIVRVVQ